MLGRSVVPDLHSFFNSCSPMSLSSQIRRLVQRLQCKPSQEQYSKTVGLFFFLLLKHFVQSYYSGKTTDCGSQYCALSSAHIHKAPNCPCPKVCAIRFVVISHRWGFHRFRSTVTSAGFRVCSTKHVKNAGRPNSPGELDDDCVDVQVCSNL